MHISDLMKMQEKDIYKLFPKKTFIKPGEYLINKKSLDIERIKGRTKKMLLMDSGNIRFMEDIIELDEFTFISHETLPEIITSYKHSSKIKNSSYIELFIKKILSKDPIKSDRYIVVRHYDVINVYFHYKTLTIKNSLGLEHDMKDFYIKYMFHNFRNGFQLQDIVINRATLTLAEYLSNYHFSHASGGCDRTITYSNLCFGSDTTIGFLAKKVMNYPINLLDLSHFFHTMYSYFTWESIEGAPYKYIQNIKNYKISNDYIDVEEPNKDLKWREIIHQALLNFDDEIDFEVQTTDAENYNVVIVSDLSRFYQKCIIIANDVFSKEYMDSIMVHENGDISGNFKPLHLDNMHELSFNRKTFHFGEELILCKIENENKITQEEIDNLYPKILSKDIKVYIRNKIQQKLTEFLTLNYKKIENYD